MEGTPGVRLVSGTGHARVRAGWYTEMRTDVASQLQREHLGPRLRTIARVQGATFAASYLTVAVLLVTTGGCLWGVSLGLLGAGVALSLVHQASHGGLQQTWFRRLGCVMYCVAGLWPPNWVRQHCLGHHLETNHHELDPDIRTAYPVLRLHQRLPPHAVHALQVAYAPLLYLLLSLQRLLVADLVAAPPYERPSILALKAAFAAVFIAIPLRLHGPAYLASFAAWQITQSGILACVFVISHCSIAAELQETAAADLTLDAWAAGQVASSVDWARDSLWAAVLSGGLNLQAEHHLLPGLSHLEIYACRHTIARHVCQATGAGLREGRLRQALAWHWGFLKRRARPE